MKSACLIGALLDLGLELLELEGGLEHMLQNNINSEVNYFNVNSNYEYFSPKLDKLHGKIKIYVLALLQKGLFIHISLVHLFIKLII